MSGIDYPALLAELERQRAASVQEIADLDELIPAVRKRAGSVVPVGLTLPPPRNGAGNGKRPTAETRGNPHDPKWHHAKRDYAAGKPVAEIAKAAGVSVATIYTRASEGKWQRPQGEGSTRLDADKLATLRTQYEAGLSGPTIEVRTGVSAKTIYKKAKEGGWKRPEKSVPPKPTLIQALATPAGHKLSGQVKCDKCGAYTHYDPCQGCGKELKRKW